MRRIPVIYVVSDSIGETAESVVRAAASQFDGGNVILRRVSHLRDIQTIEETVDAAASEGAIIAFTIILPELKAHLIRRATVAGVRYVDIMGPMMTELEACIGEAPRLQAGLVHQLDADYFRRVEAIEFAVKYDDGKDVRGLYDADVILVGVSRTSKTPLSMYLAHKTIRVANIPLVPESVPPRQLYEDEVRRKVIGLTIRPDKLNLIRQERLKALGLQEQALYASSKRIEEELAFASKVMDQLGCPVVDVSYRAVEETAGIILGIVTSRKSPVDT
ncbi:pyruvate, water dikinase regulatory protein [Alicyclobacillus dauci]|uniref:Putative pyruvate, phosphate dikinase regulatory protein n=1 Tax=Alicyclobacillus dauci TaxID=1475485 RepID=A0ABY6Z6N8_9BACL|nr:pyruvate, water dikinase regulatory protein [Alicyclobacillus dauci]WAH38554.1 kinase/pyrophosphorylase [Alicyclobacillus dauci]